VLGGGIAGITTALLLKQQGARVAVVEARDVGSGATGCSTAKVTALQSTMLTTIRRRHGLETATAYAAGCGAAVEKVASLVSSGGIECDLDRRTACTYAADSSERDAVEDEATVAREVGLDAAFTEDVDLPYATAGAVTLDGQLQMHPVRYVRGLAALVDGDGSRIFEHTRAVGVSREARLSVHAESGTIAADHVVVATHYPFLDRGLFFARLSSQRSYAIAATIRGKLPRAMSISAGSPTRSIRSAGRNLIVGGEAHKTGSGARRDVYARLEGFAREHWEVTRVSHRWSAQDAMPYDHLPMIGPYKRLSRGLYVATGFMKWGFTGGTMAAMILSDLIGGRENPWAQYFRPQRISLTSTPEALLANAIVALHFVGDRTRPERALALSDLPADSARVMRNGVAKIGVYRDSRGRLHGVSLRCPHLGCLLRFNDAERSWDCPCHGSRFDVDGAVLEGPAVHPLERREPPL
jgi:glycine/D-amino acid oxidase-like deaminating enzyme/nitrite reductase/ring-hydroxylating ferredoxin subunit